jgi:transcriptional regulator with XRE-family HTH domain
MRFHYIKEWIAFRGLTQARVAEAIDVNKSVLTKWCKYGEMPQESNIIKLSAYLNLAPEFLFRNPDELQTRIPQELSDEIVELLKRYPEKLSELRDFVQGTLLLQSQRDQAGNTNRDREPQEGQ